METSDYDELRKTFSQSTDDDLLRLTEEHDQITDEAKDALRSEMQQRGLTIPPSCKPARPSRLSRLFFSAARHLIPGSLYPSEKWRPGFMEMDIGEVYWLGYAICGVIVFIGCWIYCIATYGFLLGVGFGWLPSAIVAAIVSLFWPLLLLGIIVLIYLLVK